MAKVIIWGMFIIPWLSLLLMNKSLLKNYIPVALLATVLNTIVYQLAWTYGWWHYKVTLFSWDQVAQIHTVYGIFLVGTIWIFRFTFNKFWVYLLVNVGVDSVYAFGFRLLWKKLGITSGGNLPPMGSLSIMTVMALFLYVYQIWQQTAFRQEPENIPSKQSGKLLWVSSSFINRVRREKAK
ncbi:hypothetical protein [Paenibacillus hexagrammi]|uniref:Uncharacterized protein n=1 Tax=Paenibacillus hexagrammi TaxID=2908839 RepID=A0ABY3SKN2_9BACL|nr:hypothetical protein [Paenibacillus sp. YPD9-1]UJF34613.1 hypothetical protein L0M14_05405 [Paenibacillus sp. YPD9-1]